MVDIGSKHGVRTIALITGMDQPLGREVGNANEMTESIEVLRGHGPTDVIELTMALGEVMMELAGIDGGRAALEDAIDSGKALQKLIDVTTAQGGDPSFIEHPGELPKCSEEAVVAAPAAGFVTRCDALTIGVVATRLGAGREHQEDIIDPGVGITLEAKVGDRVEAGQTLARVAYNDVARWHAQQESLASAWTFADSRPESPDLVIERIEAS